MIPVLKKFNVGLLKRTGDAWVKLYAEKGNSDDLWATELLKQEGGHHSVIIPDLVPGDYLIRGKRNALFL